ncbi:hypothetical protein ACPPVV_01105 [Rhodanobacter sp. Col0626]|uniref:hypothetical protein n=1 Tax=Rhodanobacter sp. Col0626 TaxID=3415679 RepID=UPI003CEF2AA7
MQKSRSRRINSKKEEAYLVVADRGSDEGRRLVRISRNPDLKPQGLLWCEMVPRVVVEMMEARGRYICAFSFPRNGTTKGHTEIAVTDSLHDLEYGLVPRMIRSVPSQVVVDMQLSLSPNEAEDIRDAIALATSVAV